MKTVKNELLLYFTDQNTVRYFSPDIPTIYIVLGLSAKCGLARRPHIPIYIRLELGNNSKSSLPSTGRSVPGLHIEYLLVMLTGIIVGI
jgi:hypothetical protein